MTGSKVCSLGAQLLKAESCLPLGRSAPAALVSSIGELNVSVQHGFKEIQAAATTLVSARLQSNAAAGPSHASSLGSAGRAQLCETVSCLHATSATSSASQAHSHATLGYQQPMNPASQHQQQQHCRAFSSISSSRRSAAAAGGSLPLAALPCAQQQQAPASCARGLSTSSSACSDAAAQGSSAADAGFMPVDFELRAKIVSLIESAASLQQIQDVLIQYERSFDDTALSKTLDRVAKAPPSQRGRDNALYADIMSRASALYMHMVPTLDPLRFIQLLQTFAVLGHNPADAVVGGLQELYSKTLQDVIPYTVKQQQLHALVDLLWALGRLAQRCGATANQEVFEVCVLALAPQVAQFQSSKLSKLAQAFAMAGIYNWTLLDNIQREVVLKRADLEPVTVANLLEAYAKVNFQNESFFSQMSAWLRDRMSTLHPHHLVAICKSFARLKYDDNTFYAAAGEQLVRHMGQLKPQQLENVAWSFATRAVSDVPLYNALGNRAALIMKDFKPSNVAMLVWSFGKHGFKHMQLLTKAAEHMKTRLEDYTVKNMSNALWGFARTAYEDEALYRAIAGRMKGILKDLEAQDPLRSMKPGALPLMPGQMPPASAAEEGSDAASGSVVVVPQNLSDMAWAFSDRGFVDKEVFELMARRAVVLMPDSGRTSCVDLAWAYANAGVYHKEMFTALEGAALPLLPDFGPAYLAEFLWSCATVGHMPSDEFKTAALNTAWSKWNRVTSDSGNLAKLIWSVLQLDCDKLMPDHPIFAAFNEALENAEAAEAAAGPAGDAAPAPGGAASS